MNLWRTINENLKSKGLKRTNLYQMMQETFDNTEYEIAGYKAFLKRYDQTKLTAEELFQMSYVLDINLGDMQDIFNTHVNSLLNAKKSMTSNMIDLIKEVSYFHYEGDYYELIDFNNIPLSIMAATHYFINLNNHNDVLSVELINIDQGSIMTLGCIEEASKFIEKKFGNISTFKTINKNDKLKILLDRIELEWQMYGYPYNKTRMIIKDDVQKILSLESDDLDFDTDTLEWSYNGKCIPFKTEEYRSESKFYTSAEYTILEKTYRENEYDAFKNLNFDPLQLLTACEINLNEVYLSGSMHFVSEDSTITARVVKDIDILQTSENIDTFRTNFNKVIATIDIEELKDDEHINAKILEIKEEFYNTMKKVGKDNGIVDLPDTHEEARMLSNGYYEKEIFPIREILKNVEKLEKSKQELAKQRSFIDRRIEEITDALGEKPKQFSGLIEVLLKFEFSNIKISVYADPITTAPTLPKIWISSYIKTMKKEYDQNLVDSLDPELENKQEFEFINKMCIYNPDDPKDVEGFEYDMIPNIAFEFMKQAIIESSK